MRARDSTEDSELKQLFTKLETRLRVSDSLVSPCTFMYLYNHANVVGIASNKDCESIVQGRSSCPRCKKISPT